MGYRFRWVLFQSLVFAPFHSAVTSRPGGNEVGDPGPWRGGAHMALPVAERVSWEGCQQTLGQLLLICRILPAMYVRRKESFGVGWTNEAANFFGVQLYESKKGCLFLNWWQRRLPT